MGKEFIGVKGITALVTGAMGNLGPIWCETLLRAGANVIGLDLPDLPVSPKTENLLSEYKDNYFLLRADVLDKAQIENAKLEASKKFGFPQILVNNAGVDQPASKSGSAGGSIESFPNELFKHILNVNVTGAFNVIQTFGRDLKQGASIINIGSLYTGVSPDPAFYDHIQSDPPFLKPPAYGASKAALHNLTRYLAAHWGSRGIRVNTLSPGGVLGAQDKEFKRKFCQRVPLGRMAEFQDLVGPLLFLASSASSYVTGTELKVDGGFTAW